MNAMFKIQDVNIEGQRVYVRASIVKPQNFAVSSGSMLGGARLLPELWELPPGLFVFRLECPADRLRLRSGETVTLVT
jgi:hypothetical protein